MEHPLGSGDLLGGRAGASQVMEGPSVQRSWGGSSALLASGARGEEDRGAGNDPQLCCHGSPGAWRRRFPAIAPGPAGVGVLSLSRSCARDPGCL